MALIKVDEVMELLQVSQAKAYQVMQSLNKELKEQGKHTISGRVEEKYLREAFGMEV